MKNFYENSYCDHLLYWCSYKGSGTWESFKYACKGLEISQNTPINRWKAQDVMRLMSSLGHIDFVSESLRIWKKVHFKVSPPTFVLLPKVAGKVEKAILSGWRSPDLINKLEEKINLECVAQNSGPACIIADVENREPLIDIAQNLKIEWGDVAAERLMRLLPNLESWIECTSYDIKKENYVEEIEYWDGNRFIDGRKPAAETPVIYKSISEKPRTYWLRDKEGWKKVNRHFGFLWACKDLEPYILYRSQNNSLLVKKMHFHYMPLLFKRALALCSGLLPSKDKGYYKFQNVTYNIAKGLTERLSTNLGVV